MHIKRLKQIITLKQIGQYGGYVNNTRSRTHVSSYSPHHYLFASCTDSEIN